MGRAIVLLALLLLILSGSAARAQVQVVVVMPFDALGTAEAGSGIGASMQQTVVAELARMRGVHPVAAADAAGPVTVERAMKAARDARAGLAIYGSYHLHEGNVRFTGQVLDVSSNRFIGGLKATGKARDLFAVQEVISGQARRIVEARVTPPVAEVAEDAEVAEGAEGAEGERPEGEGLIEPLGPVPAVWPWNEANPVVDRARERIVNREDYDRVTYAYRNTYGFGSIYGFYPLQIYPYYPGVYYRYRGHRHHHHHHHR